MSNDLVHGKDVCAISFKSEVMKTRKYFSSKLTFSAIALLKVVNSKYIN